MLFALIEKTVTGLGYELVDFEQAARGLLQEMAAAVVGVVFTNAHAGSPERVSNRCMASVAPCGWRT